MILNLLEFLYNNALIVSIIVLSLLLALYLGHKWYQEVKMNRRLNIKKAMLRNLKDVRFKLPTLKRTFAVFVPVIFLGLFFVLSFDVPTDYTNHVKRVEDGESFMTLYEEFNDKFYSTPLQSTEVLEADPRITRLEHNQDGLIEGLDYVADHEGYVFVTNESGIKVVNGNEESFNLERTIGFPKEDDCEEELFDSLGIAVHGDKLVSVGYFPPAQCTNSSATLLGDPRTVIRIYDIGEDFALKDEFSISGHLNQGHYEKGQLVFASNAYLPSEPDETMLDGYFPRITHNDDREIADFSGLRYIENTNPNTFLSLTLIDVATGTYDFETTLTDYKYLLEMNADHVYLSTDSHEFDSTSEVFEMQNPIKATHTIMSKFSLKNGEIFFSKTRQHENMTASFDSLADTDSGVFALLKSESEYHFLWFDESMEEIDKLTWNHSGIYQKMDYVHHSFFLFENDTPPREIRLTNNQLIHASVPSYEKLSIQSMHPLNESNMTLALADNNGLLMFELLSPGMTVVDEYVVDGSSVSRYLDRLTVQKSENDQIFYIPLASLVETGSAIDEDKIMVLKIREEREIMVDSLIELKNIPNPMTPFVYRHLSIEGEDYHITPGGIYVTSQPSNEVTRKLRID